MHSKERERERERERCYSNRRDYKRLRYICIKRSETRKIFSVYQASLSGSDLVSKQKLTDWNQETAKNVFTAFKQNSFVVKYFLTKQIWLSDRTVVLNCVLSNTKAAIFSVIALMFFIFPWKVAGRLFFKVPCNSSLS